MGRIEEMTFKISDSQYKIKVLKRGDRGFTICTDGISIAPRAGFQINNQCPREYKLVLQECINNGWIEPVAYVTESEFVWSELQK